MTHSPGKYMEGILKHFVTRLLLLYWGFKDVLKDWRIILRKLRGKDSWMTKINHSSLYDQELLETLSISYWCFCFCHRSSYKILLIFYLYTHYKTSVKNKSKVNQCIHLFRTKEESHSSSLKLREPSAVSDWRSWIFIFFSTRRMDCLTHRERYHEFVRTCSVQREKKRQKQRAAYTCTSPLKVTLAE